ncbi:MAG: Tfp pilus assembly protein FimT/FimU [Thiohalomonadaceae bacterium]
MDVIFSRARTGHRWLHQGHTLTELLAVLAITAVIMAIAAPSFATLLQNNRLTASLNALATTLHYARSEAIKRNQPIVICKGTSDTGCNNSRTWHAGWILFEDNNGDKQWNDDEALLWSQAALPSGQTLEWNAFPSSNYTVYYPNGTASSNGTFVFCDNRGAVAAKALILAKTGRLRNSGLSASGTALQCPT